MSISCVDSCLAKKFPEMIMGILNNALIHQYFHFMSISNQKNQLRNMIYSAGTLLRRLKTLPGVRGFMKCFFIEHQSHYDF